jgi:hypothetical protein
LTRHSRAGTAGRENGVSHATVATIEHDVFNDADFFALRSLYFCACKFFSAWSSAEMILLVCT